MARARNIKPALFKNEILGTADPLYTLLFESLWLLADRAGRLEDRPLRIKAETFPYREGVDCNAMLGWLSDFGFITRYEYGGNRYIQIINFEKHQNPHKNEPGSTIPCFSAGCATTEKIGTDSEQIPKKSEALGLIPDSPSLIPDPPSPHPQADDDDRWRAELEKQAQQAEAERNAKLLQPMTAEWQPDMKILGDHLNMLMAQALVNGVKTTPEMLTDEILCRYRQSCYEQQKRKSLHEWHGGLAKYLVAYLKNPKPVEQPKQQAAIAQPYQRKYPVFEPEPERVRTEEEIQLGREFIRQMRERDNV